MAQLNMMGSHWNVGNQGWHGGNNFNGSNMSLNMMPNPGFVSNDQQMWNPWMQQQQYPYPMMPGGKRRMFQTSNDSLYETFPFCHRNAFEIVASFTSSIALVECSVKTFNDELP